MAATNTLRILIATDSHVGYNERDPIRGDDSWQSFDEVMTIAKDRDVDMVLLSGDLFHENKPSRKSMYQVMKTLRQNCYGEKPCELEILSDTSQEFQSAGGHVNYEDPDINVAIPVFSIHGNHDDPSGEGRLCALDILSVAGLVNYFGRTPENDNIQISPVLLQKGSTKLALYGLSNVRDERLFRTFRDGKVRFLRPEVQQKEWFNLMCVHQNHHGHTETGYLPENFLQEFLDLVIWGHEHECLIEPRPNPEMGFSVIQPGSSIATSLCEGESVPKHVAILSITGREYEVEPIRLKTVRPFIMKEIVLADEKEMKNVWKKNANRTIVTKFLCETVEQLIEEATQSWLDAQDDDVDPKDAPLPLIRLRVEFSSPEGHFETENPQRFSNRFVGKVANVHDIIQFYRKKAAIRRSAKTGHAVAVIDSAVLAEYGGDIENVKVENLVKEFLEDATLEILPENGLGDAVGQFVDKDDKHAVETFVEDSLKAYITKMREYEDLNEETIGDVITAHKSYLEDLFERGQVKIKRRKDKIKEKPDNWDSDIDGEWADQPAAQIHSDDQLQDPDDDDSEGPRATTSARGRGRGRGRGARGGTTATARKPAASTAAAKKKAPAKATTRGKKKVIESESEDEEMPDIPAEESDSDDDDEPVIAPPKRTRATPAASTAKKPAARAAPASKSSASRPPPKQSQLNFSASQAPSAGRRSTRANDSQASNAMFHRAVVTIPSDDEDIEDDEDDFVPMASQKATRRR
ncbi:meiotic recombination protein Mre11 [Geopyxis carbonaria]|nr:meiotic recombination protein Mre11 [Geopyxis carbonaria]